MSPTLDDLREAARGLEGIALRTPLLDTPALSERVGVPVALKCEHHQPIGAFKIRGAFTAIRRLPDAERARGVVTQSSGNHGQAVAYAARHFGIRAVIVMPESAPRVKVARIREFGGEVVFAGASRSGEQLERAQALARDEGLVMIPPYDHPDIIAGQGTCGLEILEQWPEVTTILVPVSGGGLIAGIAAAVAALRPEVRVVGVEPEGAAKLSAALAAGHPTALAETRSMADGLLTRSVGELTFQVFQPVVREAIRVSEADLAAGVKFLYHQVGETAEPSGAATTAALIAGRVRPAGPTVALVSGGNVDPELLQRLVD